MRVEGTRDPRVDAYIVTSAAFARPILDYIRETVHGACPACSETIKWSFPVFTYKGMLLSMAAFKQHCTLGFWKGSLIFGRGRDADAMGQFGRIVSLADLPPKKTLVAYIKKAARLNDEGVTVDRAARTSKAPVRVPADLAAALRQNRKAQATFDRFSPSHRREYVEWISGAKRDATRQKRLATTIQWLNEGKTQNWRYERR